MLKLARWSTTHRFQVLAAWLVLVVALVGLAGSVGASYSDNFTLPKSDAQSASDLLKRSFPSQAGDRDAARGPGLEVELGGLAIEQTQRSGRGTDGGMSS
jgi:uncharacterized membrane protein YdfJ with MMPL/SSD domain